MSRTPNQSLLGKTALDPLPLSLFHSASIPSLRPLTTKRLSSNAHIRRGSVGESDGILPDLLFADPAITAAIKEIMQPFILEHKLLLKEVRMFMDEFPGQEQTQALFEMEMELDELRAKVKASKHRLAMAMSESKHLNQENEWLRAGAERRRKESIKDEATHVESVADSNDTDLNDNRKQRSGSRFLKMISAKVRGAFEDTTVQTLRNLHRLTFSVQNPRHMKMLSELYQYAVDHGEPLLGVPDAGKLMEMGFPPDFLKREWVLLCLTNVHWLGKRKPNLVKEMALWEQSFLPTSVMVTEGLYRLFVDAETMRKELHHLIVKKSIVFEDLYIRVMARVCDVIMEKNSQLESFDEKKIVDEQLKEIDAILAGK